MSFYPLVASGILHFVIFMHLLAADWGSLAVRVLEGLAVAAIFYFLGRKFPLRVPANLTREDLATPISGWWTFSAYTLAIALSVGLFFGSVYAARALNAMWASRQGDAAFLLTPTGAWWYLYGGFLGLCMGCPAASYLVRQMMPEREWPIWLAQQNQRAGFDCRVPQALLWFFSPSLHKRVPRPFAKQRAGCKWRILSGFSS